jgi:hypothetical protein
LAAAGTGVAALLAPDRVAGAEEGSGPWAAAAGGTGVKAARTRFVSIGGAVHVPSPNVRR